MSGVLRTVMAHTCVHALGLDPVQRAYVDMVDTRRVEETDLSCVHVLTQRCHSHRPSTV